MPAGEVVVFRLLAVAVLRSEIPFCVLWRTTCCFGYEKQLKVVSAVLSGTVPSIPLCREHCKEWINPDNEISVIAKKACAGGKTAQEGGASLHKKRNFN